MTICLGYDVASLTYELLNSPYSDIWLFFSNRVLRRSTLLQNNQDLPTVCRIKFKALH